MTTAHPAPRPAGPPSTGPAPAPARVVVVGGGIAGLAAAHRLLADGAAVTLLEGAERLGGKLRAGEVGGVPVDLGAESLLARRPEAVRLARAVGLGDRIQPPTSASAGLWSRGALRPMPKGHVMGVPADPAPLAAAGVLSPEGLARIEEDARLPRTPVGEDVAVGAYVAQRLGREVVDRLVEPLLGGVYAGDAYQISLRAAVPQLFEQARTHRSLMEGVREAQRRAAEAPRPDGPVFAGIDGGIGTLPAAVADALLAGGADLRTRTRATALRRTPDGWRLTVDSPRGTDELRADAVVLAVPADAAAALLAHDVPAAAAELATVAYASMALVTLAFRRADLPGAVTAGGSSGFLVPPVEGRHIKASTFSSNKWGWVAAADPGTFVLRTSLGRHGDTADLDRDDADLVRLSLADLREAVGLAALPVDSRVVRWHGGLPQYPVGHLDRVARVREAVAAHPGLAVCGAVYEGVGIPACVASASRAAGQVLATLARATPSEE